MITVADITKEFRIPHEKTKTLFHKLSSVFRQSYDYEVLFALRQVSFTVREGEFVGIVGRNGSGKTTLLRILAGIYRPTSGTFVLGAPVSPFLDIGVGFQGDFSCRDNIYISGALLGFSRKEMNDRFRQVLEFADLTRFADARLENLSAGMKVRLAFAIAILSESPILLVDEVLAVGDTMFQRKCRDVFWNFKKSGKTALFVSHDTASIREYCDRVIVIENGAVAMEDAVGPALAYYEKNILRI
jgi:lipopolysaccharide transport system ATP-binding protein